MPVGSTGSFLAMVSEVLRLSTDERRHLAELSCSLGLPAWAGHRLSGCGEHQGGGGPGPPRRECRGLGRHGHPPHFGGGARQRVVGLLRGAAGGHPRSPWWCRMPVATWVGRCRSRCRPTCWTPTASGCSSSPRRCPSARASASCATPPAGGQGSLRDQGESPSWTVTGGASSERCRRPTRRGRWWHSGGRSRRETTARVEAIADPLARLVSLMHSLDAFVAIEKHLLVAQGIIPSARRRAPLGDDPDAGDAGGGGPARRAPARGGRRLAALRVTGSRDRGSRHGTGSTTFATELCAPEGPTAGPDGWILNVCSFTRDEAWPTRGGDISGHAPERTRQDEATLQHPAPMAWRDIPAAHWRSAPTERCT